MNDAEVRLELLRTAQTILGEHYYQKQNRAMENYEHLLPLGKENQVQFPTPPTSEDIIKEAAKLQAFVFPSDVTF